MKAANTLLLIPGFVLFAVTLVAVGEEHQTPEAPTEYLDMVNPIDYEQVDEDFLKQVGKLYKRKCSKCHGEEGDGKGSKAEFFVIKPAAFSAPGFLAKKKDGQLFWITMNGSEGTEMEPVGPDSDVGLSEEKLWQLIAYIRSRFTK
jgi:mono/diheme cytochrome c family protein